MAVTSACTQCFSSKFHRMKYFLFFFLTMSVLTDIGLITVAAITLRAKGLAGSTYDAALIVSIVVGCVGFVTTISGCLGNIREDPCKLTTFAGLLCTNIILDIACVVSIFVSCRATVLEDNIKRTFLSAYYGNQASIAIVESAQKMFQCCGYNSTTYWSSSSYSSNLLLSCMDDDSGSTYNSTCGYKITEFLEKYGTRIGIVSCVDIVRGVLGTCIALRLTAAIKRRIIAKSQKKSILSL